MAHDGYEVTDENIAAVINSGNLKHLGDCLDRQWEIIRFAIRQTLKK